MGGDDTTDLGTLGQRVGYLRRRAALETGRDVSRRDVADVLGVSQTIVGQWETGEKSPGRDRVLEIAAAFSVPKFAGWLLTGDGPAPTGVRLRPKPDKREVELKKLRRKRREG